MIEYRMDDTEEQAALKGALSRTYGTPRDALPSTYARVPGLQKAWLRGWDGRQQAVVARAEPSFSHAVVPADQPAGTLTGEVLPPEKPKRKARKGTSQRVSSVASKLLTKGGKGATPSQVKMIAASALSQDRIKGK